MVRTVISSQLVFFAMECELAILDAVSVAANKYAQERLRRIDDILYVVMSLNKIGVISVLVLNKEGYTRGKAMQDGTGT